MLESLAALVVVAGVVTAALASAAVELRTSRRAVSTVEASALAEDLLLRSRFREWDALAGYGAQDEGHFDPPLDRYRWKLQSAPVDGIAGLVDVTATVWWSDGQYVASTRFAAPDDSLP